jgi:predicted nucleotidyltransferase component of viral defense system
MLYYRTIYPETLELLIEIQSRKLFKDLRLVGGTALALQINHRMSNDLDLFGSLVADKISVLNELHRIGEVKVLQSTENINIFTLNGIKVDLVNYPYMWLKGEIKKDKIVIANIEDIAAMKLSAITGRGTKKDFIDLYFLLKIFSLQNILDLYDKKYPDGSKFLVLKSLTYFDDADQDVPPKMFKKNNWDNIKETISRSVKNFVNK